MNLNQIYYFNKLAKKHQFSKAAKQLNISQPSLSNSIKALEKDMNCDLIERRDGRIELTKYGQIFFNATNSIISILAETKQNIDETKRLESNTIEIGCIPTASKNFLAQVIYKFKKQSSIIFNYIYHENTSDQICRQINNKNYDIGICTKNIKFPNLIFIPLYVENTHFNFKTLSSKLELTQNKRTIYLVYNPKSKLSEAALALKSFITTN